MTWIHKEKGGERDILIKKKKRIQTNCFLLWVCLIFLCCSDVPKHLYPCLIDTLSASMLILQDNRIYKAWTFSCMGNIPLSSSLKRRSWKRLCSTYCTSCDSWQAVQLPEQTWGRAPQQEQNQLQWWPAALHSILLPLCLHPLPQAGSSKLTEKQAEYPHQLYRPGKRKVGLHEISFEYFETKILAKSNFTILFEFMGSLDLF